MTAMHGDLFPYALVAVLVSSSVAAQSPMLLVDGNRSSCRITSEQKNEVDHQTVRTSLTRDFLVRGGNLQVRASTEGLSLFIEYPISNGKIGNHNRYEISGSAYDRASDKEKEIFKNFIDAVPIYETMFSGRILAAGDMAFDDTITSWLKSYVKNIDSGATMGVPRNEVRVSRIEEIRGRRTIVATGPTSVDFYIRGNALVLSFLGDFFIDAQSGLLAGWNVKTKISFTNGILITADEQATCQVEGGSDLAPAAISKSEGNQKSNEGVQAQAPKSRSVRERLESLDRLLKDGLIAPDEAARKREEILRDL